MLGNSPGHLLQGFMYVHAGTNIHFVLCAGDEPIIQLLNNTKTRRVV
jgi:hypothetical protein